MSSPRVSMREKLQRANGTLFMAKKLLFVLLLVALDVRDVVYKVAWIGPADSYAFQSGSTSVLHPEPLVSMVTSEVRALDAGEHVASGWSSFLSQCDELRAFGAADGLFFLSALGTNCSLRVGHNVTRVVSQLVLTSSIRADALVWASCLFLHIARRPSICQDHIATHFNDRYAFAATTVVNNDVARPASDTEAEILQLLALLSVSIPLHRVVCVEAFELARGATGTFTPTIYGCASPNEFESTFVGLAAPQYHRLLWGKSWLTNDEIAVLGQRFGIRQNARSRYVIASSAEHGSVLTITSVSHINFSSYGPLYALMVVLEVWLLLTHCYSVVEILKWMFVPKYRELQVWIREFEASRDSSTVAPETRQQPTATNTACEGPPRVQHVRSSSAATLVFQEERFYALFCASYYKASTYVALLRLTRVLSWIIIVPNSVVWTWSEFGTAKVQAFLSSIKSWVLIATALQLFWRACVYLNEARAYTVARGTYITHLEIIGVGALAAVLLRDDIFLMCEHKWQVEHQRVNDATSFQGGYVAHGNTFERENDYRTTTSHEILAIVYGPLVRIVLLSLAMIVCWLLVKFAFFAARARVATARRRSSTIVITSQHEHVSDKDSAMKQRSGPPRFIADIHTSRDSDDLSASAYKPYARLPLEVALDIPIRASSLVRYGLSMEVARGGKWYIRPSCYLDYGVMLKHGVSRAHGSVAEIFRRSRYNRRMSSMVDLVTSCADTSTLREPIVCNKSQLLSNHATVTTQMLFDASTLAGQDALLAACSESLDAALDESDDIARSCDDHPPSAPVSSRTSELDPTTRLG